MARPGRRTYTVPFLPLLRSVFCSRLPSPLLSSFPTCLRFFFRTDSFVLSRFAAPLYGERERYLARLSALEERLWKADCVQECLIPGCLLGCLSRHRYVGTSCVNSRNQHPSAVLPADGTPHGPLSTVSQHPIQPPRRYRRKLLLESKYS